jgi:nucleoside-diphosphate-sugar epimerase
VAEALVRAGHDVLRGARIAPAGGAWIGYGEVGRDTRWDDALAGIDVVVHLAGLAHLPDEMAAAAADTFARVNAEGTARLAAAAVRSGVRRFVLMSSALVHGQASPGRPFTESDAPAPATPYARSKLDSETRLEAAARGSALEWVILRPPMVYGPGARGNFRRLVQLVRAGVPLPLGAATAPKSFIGIDNLADAVVRCIEHQHAANQVFVVADAEITSTVGLVHLIAAALGRRIWTPRVPPVLLRAALGTVGRSRDVHRLFDPLQLDISRIRKLLDWSPPVSLAEGVRRAVKE